MNVQLCSKFTTQLHVQCVILVEQRDRGGTQGSTIRGRIGNTGLFWPGCLSSIFYYEQQMRRELNQFRSIIRFQNFLIITNPAPSVVVCYESIK